MGYKQAKLVEADGFDFTDVNIKYVNLKSGTYQIDDEIVTVPYSYHDDNWVGVKDFNNIRIVNITEYIQKYVCGENSKSVEEYETEKVELLSHRKTIDADEGTYIWDSLEAEFNYRKFIQLWQPVKISAQTISEPIKVAVKKMQYETDNEFIKSCFLNGSDKDTSLFIYKRPEAVQKIVADCFNELGMKFEGDCSYGKTEGKKIWGNSTHSCIRYVVAFGTYVMNDGWDIRSCPKGTYNDLIKQYNNDKKALRNIIITKYNKHFGKIDQGTFEFDKLLSQIKSAQTYISNIDPKQKSYNDKQSALKRLKESIELIESSYSVPVSI
jgi:hypothetical protein